MTRAWLTRCWLLQRNPNGRPNTDVVRPWSTAWTSPDDPGYVDHRLRRDMPEEEAALYEAALRVRASSTSSLFGTTGAKCTAERKYWWLHRAPAPGYARSRSRA